MSNLYVTQTVNGDLQPVKVNGESSALEIAQDEIKVKTLEIDGISKVPTPTANHHIANKKYVDDNAGGGGFSSFTLTGDSGSDQTIEDGNTVDIEGGTGIDTTVGTTDKVSIALASGAALANLSGGSGTTFLKKDGTWATPTDTNTTYTAGDFITLTGTDFDVDVKDEDNMASNSATHLCTQQSIKAYVDTTQYSTLVCGMNYNLSGGTFCVLSLSGATRPLTTFNYGIENTIMIAPFSGSLEKIMFRCEEVAGDPVVIGFHRATTGTEYPSTTPVASVSIDMSGVADDTSTEFAFTSSNTFSKGDAIGFSIDPDNDINDAIFTIVLKYDITT